MTQYVINIGALPNDGTGDPLRTAFNETNLNFDQVFAAGPVLSNIRIANNTILTTTTNGNLILAPNGTGVVQSNVHVVPNTANIRNLGASDRRWATVYTQYLDVSANLNISGNIIYNGDLVVDGNLTVQGNIIQIGNIVTDSKTIQLANTATTDAAANGSGITVGASDDIATLLYHSGDNVWTTNIGLQVGGPVTGASLAVSSATVYGNIAAINGNFTGNVIADYFIGDGSQLTNLPIVNYSNANVGAYLPTYTGNLSANNVTVGTVYSPNFYGNAVIYTNATGYLTSTNLFKYNPGTETLTVGSASLTGNITADYFIGDGSQLTNLPGGNANTGNVTFNDINIIGTGNLKLQPDSANASAYLDIYLTTGPDIHIAGNGETVILGTDDFANVTVNVDGNVSIQANNGTPHTWTFGTDGRLINLEGLTLTAGGQFNICTILTGGSGYNTGSALKATTGGSGTGMTVGIGYGLSNQLTNATVVDPGTGYVDGDVITVSEGTGGTFVITRYNDQANQGNNNFIESNWVFGNAGNLTLPGNTFSVNYANGDPVTFTANTGNVTFNDQVVQGTGDESGGSGLYLAPGTNSTGNLQYLRVRGGDYPTHIHLDTGNNAFFDQYFGADSKFVKLEANGNIVINADDGANSATWNFDTGGDLTIPGNILGSGNILIAPDSASASSYLDIYLTGGPDIHIASNDNSIVIGRDTGANVFVGNDGEVSIQANAGTPYTWTFGTDGNLTVPGGGAVWTLGAGTAGLTANILDPYQVNLGLDYTSNTATLAGANSVAIQSNTGANTNQWNFDATGNLTVPGNIIMTTGIVASALASPAPYLSGFSSVSAITVSASGNITGGNIVTTGSGGDITMTGGNITGANVVSANTISSVGNISINSSGNIWIFDTTGNATFPANGTTNLHDVRSVGLATFSNVQIGGNLSYAESANLIIVEDKDGFGDIIAQNKNSGGNASMNIVLVNNDPGNVYMAVGVNSSTFTPLYNTLFEIPDAGYVSHSTTQVMGPQSAESGTSKIYFTYNSGSLALELNDFGAIGWGASYNGNLTQGNFGNVGQVLTSAGNSSPPTWNNAVSVAGNITGNYFIGNGSQLTGITASVPSQTILPTIQTITVEARPAGLFGGGQGGANVTVANTIPVTEYGVIITDGTTSEKYKTGSLGSIPGTVSLTFTTGLNSAQFTVFAYVTSNAGTYYSNSATGTSGICLLAGTQIALSDGTRKAIEHITYTDKMLSWDFDRGCYAETTALWIKRGETGSQYNLLTFSDGTTLRTFDQHRIFNKQAGAFTYPMTDATPVGTVTVNEHGQEITLTNKQVIVDTIEYYNVITDHHMNLFSDTVLTSCRFNNIYPIIDMKFVKDGRTLRTRAEFENIPDRFFYGLRLAEQTTDIETVEWYVNRLLRTEVSTESELTV